MLSNGRTAHSRFKIPLTPHDSSTCNINKRSELADLIKASKLIIWDEAPMAHKFCFESVDRTLRDITSIDMPFGDKVMVSGGDFRQVLPVVRNGTRFDIVQAALKNSYLWKNVKILKLTINMRVHASNNITNNNELSQFADWLLEVGEGRNFIDGTEFINLPQSIVHNSNDVCGFIDYVFGDLNSNYQNMQYIIG